MMGSIWDIYKQKLPIGYLLFFSICVIWHQITEGKMVWYELVMGAGVGVIFLMISKMTEEQIGYGDSWMILNMGIFLGVWRVLLMLCLGFTICAVFSGIGMMCRKLRKESRIPFLPFLLIAYMGVIWW